MGNRDRPAEPAENRGGQGLEEGSSPFDTESPRGREALLTLIQSQLEGGNLVDELLLERRQQAAMEDAW